MDSTIYQAKRKELIGLLERGETLLEAAMDGMPSWKIASKELRETKRKLQEDQFSIVLLADMQGGKSTVFNAVACEGRELSPMGFGIRTSGCSVAAQNLSNPEEPERAEVQWRTSADLIAGFSEQLYPRFHQIDAVRFNNPESVLHLDLESPEDLLLIHQAAKLEQDEWNRARAAYNQEIDVFRFALLLAEFYNHPEIKELRTTERSFQPEETSSFLRYPWDWVERWDKGDPKEFQPREVIFAFIRSVRFFVHAPMLGKIGSVLVDCPGLFASRFDTEVADNAMSDASAILYLCPGAAAISLKGLGVLREIRSRGMEHKLFFGWNMRTSAKNAERLMANLKAVLNQDDFKPADSDFFLIHAALALRSKQALNMLEANLDTHTISQIAEREQIAPDKVPDKVWGNIAKFRRNLADDDDIEVTRDLATAQAAQAESHINELLTTCEDFIVRKKASFVLVENGAEVVASKLEEVEGDLKQRESIATKQVEKHQAEMGKAEGELRNFEGRCAEIVVNEFDSASARNADQQFADEFCDRLDDRFRQRLVDEITGRLDKEVIGVKMLWDGMFNKEKLNKRIEAICVKVMSTAIDAEFKAWLESVESGKSPIYRREIASRVAKAQKKIQEEWQSVAALNTDILDQIPIPQISQNIREAVQQAPAMFEGRQVQDPAVRHLIQSGSLVIGALISAIGAAVALHAAASVGALHVLIFGPSAFGPVGWTLSGLAAVLAAAFWFLGGRGSVLKKLEAKITQDLNAQWGSISKEVGKSVVGLGLGIRCWYQQAFRKEVVGNPRRIFESRKAESEKLFRKSQREREFISWEAKKMREEKIEPLRCDLEQFAETCRKLLPAQNSDTP